MSGAGDAQPVLVVVQVDHHGVAVGDLAGQQRLGERVADRRLDQPAQRPGTVPIAPAA